MGAIRHVYILGAGFSVPLGGPLFDDLLSKNSCVTDRLENCNSPGAVALGEMHLGMKTLSKRFPKWNAEQWIEAIASIECDPTSNLSTSIVSNLAGNSRISARRCPRHVRF